MLYCRPPAACSRIGQTTYMWYFLASSPTALVVGPGIGSALVPANSSGRQAMSTPFVPAGFEVLGPPA